MSARQKEAVAVRYDQQKESAPRVIAKGRGAVAERIIAVAREHGIPTYEDKDLLALLAAVEVFDEIPAELYAAVAEVLVWVYKNNKGHRPEILSQGR